MGGDEAIHHEKHVSRLFFGLMMMPALFALAVAAWVAFTEGPLPALVGLLSFLIVTLSALYFAVMRITVTPTHVQVRYGNMGKSIPLAAITKAEVEKLDGLSRVAFGAKWEGPGRWRYVPPGVEEGVRVTWSEGGKPRSSLIGARDAPALLHAIERARAGTATSARVRVDAGEDEAEVEAPPPEGAKKRRSADR
jgi:hypothetical protein